MTKTIKLTKKQVEQLKNIYGVMFLLADELDEVLGGSSFADDITNLASEQLKLFGIKV